MQVLNSTQIDMVSGGTIMSIGYTSLMIDTTGIPYNVVKGYENLLNAIDKNADGSITDMLTAMAPHLDYLVSINGDQYVELLNARMENAYVF